MTDSEKKNNTTKIERKAGPERDVVVALLVIFAGVVLLMNTTGVLPWSVWEYLVTYWPLLLILAGFKMMLGGLEAANLLLTALTLVVIVVITLVLIQRYPEMQTLLDKLNGVSWRGGWAP